MKFHISEKNGRECRDYATAGSNVWLILAFFKKLSKLMLVRSWMRDYQNIQNQLGKFLILWKALFIYLKNSFSCPSSSQLCKIEQKETLKTIKPWHQVNLLICNDPILGGKLVLWGWVGVEARSSKLYKMLRKF